jgi:hypothetical protein
LAFHGKTKRAQQQFSSPEELYLSGALPRTTEAVDGLWLHQGDVIRAYAEHHHKTRDLALELPTGSGKTIPGLLIAEWVRRKSEGPVIYATPTKLLARQVLATARREGVPSHLLIGGRKNWDVAEESAVEGAEAIGVTTYSSIFNSSPKLPEPRLIVLDDAHAGEQFVGDEYGVKIRRYKHPEAYEKVLTALSSFLSGLLLQRLRGTSSGSTTPSCRRPEGARKARCCSRNTPRASQVRVRDDPVGPDGVLRISVVRRDTDTSNDPADVRESDLPTS